MYFFQYMEAYLRVLRIRQKDFPNVYEQQTIILDPYFFVSHYTSKNNIFFFISDEFVLFDIIFLCTHSRRWNFGLETLCPTMLGLYRRHSGRRLKAKFRRVCLCVYKGHFHHKAYLGRLRLMYEQDHDVFIF